MDEGLFKEQHPNWSTMVKWTMKQRDQIMAAFKANEIQILPSTTVIEVGQM